MLIRIQSGLVPSNYLTMVDEDAPAGAPGSASEPPPAAPAADAGHGATATALYDYEAAEENELAFPENAIISNVVSTCILGYAGFFPNRRRCRHSLTRTGGMANTRDAQDCSRQITPS